MINRRRLIETVGACSVAAVLPRVAFGQQNGQIKVGVIQPQQGDCAQWGLPITRAVEMWAAEINDAGGVEADGKTHMLTVTGYDNVCYAAGDELKAARRAILDDSVRYLLQTYTPSCRQAIAQLTNETSTLVTSYGAGYLSKEFPFLLGGETGQPMGNMLAVSAILDLAKDGKKIAVITSDTAFGKAARAYILAGISAHPDAEIVYAGEYGASATNDMLGLLTPLIQSSPDVIYEMGFTPGQKATMVSTMEQLGFKGIYGSESWEVNFLRDAGVLDAVAGRVFSGPAIDAQEPTFSPRAHQFYKNYVAKYGEAEWAPWASAGYAAMGVFEVGWKAAKSVDAKVVMEALASMEVVDHPVFGASQWGGANIFGANKHLLTPQPIYGVSAEGQPVLTTVISPAEWLDAHHEGAVKALTEGGQTFL